MIFVEIYTIYKLIGVEAGQHPWGLAKRGTKAKTITSCDNTFVTNIVLLMSLRCTTLSRKKHLLARDPAAQRMFSVRKRSDSKCFICAKAKRQQQQQQQKRLIGRPQESAQSERKSTTRYGKDS
ncbi:hypothetical protein ACQKNC_21330 [Lysinibacillus sp. NPDC094177]|uniref:hypothetical protein n=1 Tax=Lysinibacillus sp. NPDC094177 TaxID=3390580 RepID=UPI003CFD55BF